MRRPRPPRGCRAIGKKKRLIVLTNRGHDYLKCLPIGGESEFMNVLLLICYRRAFDSFFLCIRKLTLAINHGIPCALLHCVCHLSTLPKIVLWFGCRVIEEHTQYWSWIDLMFLEQLAVLHSWIMWMSLIQELRHHWNACSIF